MKHYLKLLLAVAFLKSTMAYSQSTCATDCPTFNGHDSYISIANSDSVLGTSGTFEAWIYPTSASASDFIYVQTYCCGLAQTIFGVTGGRLDLENAQAPFVGSWLSLLGKTVLSNNQWYHVAASWNTDAFGVLSCALYLNGCLDAYYGPAGTDAAMGSSSYTTSIQWYTSSNHPLTIGGWDYAIATDPSHSWSFNGRIDEARIWNYARSQCDIIDNMELLDFFKTGYSGLSSYYQFNESPTPSVTADGTGNGYDGTLNNISTWTTSDAPVISQNATTYTAGCAPSFSNPNSLSCYAPGHSYVSTAASNSILGTSGSFEVWLYPTDIAEYDFIFAQTSGPGLAQTHLSLETGHILLGNSQLTPNVWLYLESTSTLTSNQWYHVAATWNTDISGTLTAAVYINGCLDAYYGPTGSFGGANSTTYSTSVFWNTNTNYPLNIGGWEYGIVNSPTTAYWSYSGQIDEARVWSIARAQSDIISGMYHSVSFSTTGLEAYYKFDEGGAATTASNSANSSYTGTLINSPSPAWSSATVAPIDPQCSGGCRMAGPVGIKENHIANNSLSIYPNPSEDDFNVSFSLTKNERTILNIIDLNGRTVMSVNNGMLAPGDHLVNIKTRDLKNGIYICTLVSNTETQRLKLVVDK